MYIKKVAAFHKAATSKFTKQLRKNYTIITDFTISMFLNTSLIVSMQIYN